MKNNATPIQTAACVLLLAFAGAKPAWPAPLDKAEAAYDAGDYKRAAELFRAAAEEGDPAAQNRLACMYMAGQGVAKDYDQARVLYRKAAEKDLAKAQANLGTLYFEGVGVRRDYLQALAWYSKAAAQGLAFAQEKLGRMYQEGLGASRDDTAAAQRFAAAKAAQTREPAPKTLEIRQEREPPAFALVIGIEKYADLPEARFAERDAKDVARLLSSMGYPRGHIHTLLGSRATREGIARYLERWLPEVAGPGSTVFVYFAGLGAPDIETREAYLVPWDGGEAALALEDYPLRRMYAVLDKLKASQVIVALDAGFSGAAGRSVIAAGSPVSARVAPRTASGKLIVFAGASEFGGADVLEECRHGLFTCRFLEGLGGKALAASGSLTAGGLYDYLRPLVAEHAMHRERPQTPLLFGARDALILRAKH